MIEPINAFIIYAKEDNEIKHRLLAHLNPLKNPFNLTIWHDDFIEAGQEWRPHITSRLEQTDLFLLLVSVDFMNSEFINQVEFKYAIDRHKADKSIVIPVIINYCQWDVDVNFKDYTFNLNELQVLPDEAKPVGDWKTPEQAFNNIAGGVRKVLYTIKSNREQKMAEDEKHRLEEELKLKKTEEELKLKKTEEEQTHINIEKKEKEDPAKEREKEEKEMARRKAIEKQVMEERKKKEGEEKKQGQKVEKDEKNEAYIDETGTKIQSPGINKKIIYSSLILLATIVILYFVFRKPGNLISATPQTIDTSQTIKGNDSPKTPIVSSKEKTNITPGNNVENKDKNGSGKENSSVVDTRPTDIDGNVYNVVVIGQQTWMKENLKTTHYRNGDAVTNIPGYAQWGNNTTGAYCNYKNNASNAKLYGRLYNWYAINNPAGLCPKGWHIPTDAEWQTLSAYLGGESTAGSAMKATTNWVFPNQNNTMVGNNSSHFTGLPGGYRSYQTAYETFGNLGWFGYFWSSSENSGESAWMYFLRYDNSKLWRDNEKKGFGASCRCIKD